MRRPRDKRLYWVWADMLSRCRNKNHKAYANYGGRGISVCAEWLSFDQFMGDIGPRPEGAMLDRADNNGPYAPGNCRWATRTEQNSNRRNCILVHLDGRQVTLREYCRAKGLNYRPIVKRIRDRGWPVHIALTAPLGTRYSRREAA